jgi:hypothetical protein
VYKNFGRIAFPSLVGFCYGAGVITIPMPALYFARNSITGQNSSLAGLVQEIIPTVISGGFIGMTLMLAITSTILRLPSIQSLRRVVHYSNLVPTDALLINAARLASIEYLSLFIMLGAISPVFYITLLDPLSKLTATYGEHFHRYDTRLVWLAIIALVVTSSAVARWNIHRRSGAPLALKSTLIYLHSAAAHTPESSGFLGPTADPIGKNRAILAQLADNLEVYANWLPRVSAREVVTNPLALIARATTRQIRAFVRGRASLDEGSTREIDQILQELAIVFAGPSDLNIIGSLADRLKVFEDDGTPSADVVTPTPSRIVKILRKSSAGLEATERRAQSIQNLLPLVIIAGVLILVARGDWGSLAEIIVGKLGGGGK